MHPGGFVIGSIAMDELALRPLAKALDIVIVSVNYRLAPEHPFPAAPDDAEAALRWVLANAAALGGDAGRIAVAGDSAGAQRAISELDRRQVGGRSLTVNEARPMEPRSDGGFGGGNGRQRRDPRW